LELASLEQHLDQALTKGRVLISQQTPAGAAAAAAGAAGAAAASGVLVCYRVWVVHQQQGEQHQCLLEVSSDPRRACAVTGLSNQNIGRHYTTAGEKHKRCLLVAPAPSDKAPSEPRHACAYAVAGLTNGIASRNQTTRRSECVSHLAT
jgi:hypothetical protein